MSDILTEVNRAQTNQEAIDALRAQVKALTKERDELLWAALWSNGDGPDDEYMGQNIRANKGKVEELLAKYATTAPTAEQGA
jgi:hypothetical protein